MINKYFIMEHAKNYVTNTWNKDGEVNYGTIHYWSKLFEAEPRNAHNIHLDSTTNKKYTTDKNVLVLLENFLDKRMSNYTPRLPKADKPKKASNKVETVASALPNPEAHTTRSSASLVMGLERNITHLREMGYTVKCTVHAPGREL